MGAGRPASTVSEELEQQWRRQIKQVLFIPDPLPALADRKYGQFSPEPGIVAERIAYGKQLDLHNWDEASIRALGETHIGQWAQAKGVEIDRVYSNEQCEGGTPALATAVPGLSREQLSVFGLEEWQRQKGLLVYESRPGLEQKAMKVGQIMWDLDNLNEIGGYRPMVLGTPRIIEAPAASALIFDGQDDGIILDTNPLVGAQNFTVEAIFRPDTAGGQAQRFLHMQSSEENRVLMETRLNDRNEWFLDTFIKSGKSEKTLQSKEILHPLAHWYHVALTYDGHTMRHYVDRVEEVSGEVEYTPVGGGQTSIGCRLNRAFWFKGAIRKIRITHAALNPNQFLEKTD